MEMSVFPDKSNKPTDADLVEKLGDSYALWKEICSIVLAKYPQGKSEWNFPGKKYGWSFRIKDKRRAIIYLLPRAGQVKVAFVFGDKAVAKVTQSGVSPSIKSELKKARKYAEGRGIQLAVEDESTLTDIRQLVDIKLSR